MQPQLPKGPRRVSMLGSMEPASVVEVVSKVVSKAAGRAWGHGASEHSIQWIAL